MGDLDKLIAAVEAGEWATGLHLPYELHTDLTWKAFNGSLDAALRLHEALLPGYPFPNATTTTEVVIFGVSRPGEAGATGWSKVPSRAWLLAILRALQAQPTPLDEHGNPLDPRRRG